MNNIDPQRIYRELSELAGYYLEGQNPDFLLSRVRLAVKRLRAILPADPELCDGISVEESLAVSDFIRHTAALYFLDSKEGLQDPVFFSPYLDEELRRLIKRFRPAADLPQEPGPQATTATVPEPKADQGEPPAVAEPEQPSKETLALVTLHNHPDWTDKKIAAAAGCNRTTLYTFEKFKAAKEILRQGRNDLPRGSKYPDEPMEAWDNEGDG